MKLQLLYDYVEKVFPGFGENKRNAIVRLLSEIARRDGVSFESIISDELTAVKDFFQIKSFLLKLRYPSLDEKELAILPPLTELQFSESKKVKASSTDRFIKKVFHEKGVSNSALLLRLRQKLPGIPFQEIKLYSDYVKKNNFSIEGFNRRCDTLFIVKENYDFFLHCPCSKPSRPCDYHIMNAGMGCIFECVYCYLQGYTNSPGLVIPGNLDECLEKFAEYYRPGMRLGTGQFTDSLAMDDLTGFAPQIINFFKNFPDVQFEFKTKSNCIENILAIPSTKNVLISWSMNPQRIIDSSELLTASLDERLEAARKCSEAGYSVGFHFDPIIFYDGWSDDYKEVVDRIFSSVETDKIAWISLGCLRMAPRTHQVMEQRFPESELLFAEQILGFDGKVRYSRKTRKDIYRHMLTFIQAHSSDVMVYLCMEDEEMNHELMIPKINTCR